MNIKVSRKIFEKIFMVFSGDIVPCLVKMFSSTDRATRIQLLRQIEHIVCHLKKGLQPTPSAHAKFIHIIKISLTNKYFHPLFPVFMILHLLLGKQR